MKTSSCKAKGRRLQQLVVKKILEAFPDLTSRDVQSTSMGATGEDIKLSQAAFQHLPVGIECKNKEANKSLLNDWKQTESHCTAAHPVLVLSANNSPVLAVIDLSLLIYLFKNVRNNVASKG